MITSIPEIERLVRDLTTMLNNAKSKSKTDLKTTLICDLHYHDDLLSVYSAVRDLQVDLLHYDINRGWMMKHPATDTQMYAKQLLQDKLIPELEYKIQAQQKEIFELKRLLNL
jgi:hypothetical protein